MFVATHRRGNFTPPVSPSRRSMAIPEHGADAHRRGREGAAAIDADQVLIPSSKIFHDDGSINNPFVLGRLQHHIDS